MDAQLVNVEQIRPSRTNPRGHMEKQALGELAESVKRHGVLQPMLVRPLAGESVSFEVVCGHRRLAAAKQAGLAQVPVTVRNLSEAEAIELQVIENLQRSDLHPMEEAEGYLQLTKKHGYTVEDLAAKVSKSKPYVYGRLRLTALHPDLKRAFLEGKMLPAVAFLFARVHDQRQALAAFKQAFQNRWPRSDAPLSAKDATAALSDLAMRDLSKAPFNTKDPQLVVAAGSCVACPKRSGNQPDLFSDLKGGNTCTDPGCFTKKADAAWDLRKQHALASGSKVLEGKAAAKVLSGQYGSDAEFVKLDEINYSISDSKKPRQLLKQQGVEFAPVIARDPDDGEVVELVARKDLVKWLPKAARGGAAKSAPSPDAKYRLEHEKRNVEMRAMVTAATEATVRWLDGMGFRPTRPTSEKGFGLFWEIVEAFVLDRSTNDWLMAELRARKVQRLKVRKAWGNELEGASDALKRWLRDLPADVRDATRVEVVLSLIFRHGAWCEKGARGALDVVAAQKLADPDKAGAKAVAELMAQRQAKRAAKKPKLTTAAKKKPAARAKGAKR